MIRNAIAWFLIVSLCLAPAAGALAQGSAPVPALHLQNVELRAFIQDVARATGTTFIVDPRVQGTVDVHRDEAMGDEDLIGVLLAVLRGNGLIAVPAGRATYRIVPDDTAAQQPGSAGALGFTTQVFRLQRIDARSAAETLKPLVGRGGVVVALPRGNDLLVADYVDNVRRIRGLVERIDRDSASIDTVTLRNTSAREIAGTLADIYGVSSDSAGVLSVLPVESSNSLVIRGDATVVREVVKMALDLDTRAENTGNVAVVRLQHASADQLLGVLQQLIGQTPDATTGAAAEAARGASPADAASAQIISPAAGKRPTIVRYPGSNSLVIHADPDTQRTLLDVIRQLDVRREQVLVEAVVVEISDDAAKRLGAQLLYAGRDGNVPVTATQFSGSGVGLMPIAGAALAGSGDDGEGGIGDLARQAAARSLLGLSGGLFGLGGRGSDSVFGIIIDAVQSDTGSNLLSTPSILTLDNEEARILVGQEVPLTTGEALSSNYDNAFRTIQREDVGIQLTVRPQINSGGGITLEIKQEVSGVAGPVSADFQELVLNKREIETNVVVDDGEIVVLGGLLDQNDRHTVEKIPLLGDIPVLGSLFRSRSRSGSRTNLMVFLRPTIIRNGDDARRETGRSYSYLRDLQLRGGSPEAALDVLVRDYLRTAPPSREPAPAPAPVPPAEQ